MIQVVLIDIDNTLLSFSGYIKEAMRDGFCTVRPKTVYRSNVPLYLNGSTTAFWEQIEQGTLSF